MAEEEVTAESQGSKGGGKGLVITLVILVVVLLIALGVGGYFLYSKMSTDEGGGAKSEQGAKKAESEENSMESYKASIDDLVLNITNAKGREKLMKLSFTIKSSNANIEGIVEENRAEIIDTVIAQISARTAEELLTVGGKALLKEELLDEINRVLNESMSGNEDYEQNSVRKLFFTAFVIK
jgi:flagellar FliL protein